MVLRRQHWKAILILLLVIGTAYSQTASFAASHSHNHASHCCGVCHAGHLSALHSADRVGFIPLTLLCWRRPAEHAARALDPEIVFNFSRGPPA